jgi:hypothetical protein
MKAARQKATTRGIKRGVIVESSAARRGAAKATNLKATTTMVILGDEGYEVAESNAANRGAAKAVGATAKLKEGAVKKCNTKEEDVLCPTCNRQSDSTALCLPVTQYDEDTSKTGDKEGSEGKSDEEDEDEVSLSIQIASGLCCCGCGLDVAQRNHYCIHTGTE